MKERPALKGLFRKLFPKREIPPAEKLAMSWGTDQAPQIEGHYCVSEDGKLTYISENLVIIDDVVVYPKTDITREAARKIIKNRKP